MAAGSPTVDGSERERDSWRGRTADAWPGTPSTLRTGDTMFDGERLIAEKVVMIDDELNEQSASGRASRALAKELRDRGVVVVEATSVDDGKAIVLSDPSLQGVLMDWAL